MNGVFTFSFGSEFNVISFVPVIIFADVGTPENVLKDETIFSF